MMEAEQIAKAFERQFTSLEKRNHDLMLTIADLAAKNTDLEAQLAARDAEIAAWLRESIPQDWPHERGALMTGTPVIPVHPNELIADAIERGAYRKETP